MADLFWNERPSQLSHISGALPIALEVYRGNIDILDGQASLAVLNLAGYIDHLRLGNPGPPIFGAVESATTAEVEQAFSDAIAASQHPVTMSASPVGTPWLAILAPVILGIVKHLLDRLSFPGPVAQKN